VQIQRYKSFVQANAESIWSKAACTLGASVGVGEPLTALPVFGTSWVLPCGTVPGGWTAAAQTSALDVLIVQQQLACVGEEHGLMGRDESYGKGVRPPARGLPTYFLAD
jgi:hypothetical protein